jgi:putative membrane protein
MWWPVLSTLPELPPISPPGQLMYLFFQSLAPTIPASFLTFGSTILYAPYATFPRIWGISPRTDQMIAGLEMKLLGGAILWGFLTVIFFRWHAREEREGWDALKWQGVEREIRTELAKR